MPTVIALHHYAIKAKTYKVGNGIKKSLFNLGKIEKAIIFVYIIKNYEYLRFKF